MQLGHSYALMLDDHKGFCRDEIVKVVGQAYSYNFALLKLIAIDGSVRACVPMDIANHASGFWEVTMDIQMADGEFILLKGDKVMSFEYYCPQSCKNVARYFTFEGDDFTEVPELYLDAKLLPI